MNAAHAKYLTMAVPRYTSYPTVPHFSEAVGHGAYEGWLSRLDAVGADLALPARALLQAALLVLRLQHEARLPRSDGGAVCGHADA